MGYSKIRVLSKFKAWVFQIKAVLPKHHNNYRNIVMIHTRSHHDDQHGLGGLDKGRRTENAQDSAKSSMGEDLSSITAYLNAFEDPLDKYHYLLALREHETTLYYRYLCENTSQVLSILCAVNGLVDSVGKISDGDVPKAFRDYWQQIREELSNRQLDTQDTVTLLRNCVNTRTLKQQQPPPNTVEAIMQSQWAGQGQGQLEAPSSQLLGSTNQLQHGSVILKNMERDIFSVMKRQRCKKKNKKRFDEVTEEICEKREKERKELQTCLHSFQNVIDYVHPHRLPYVSYNSAFKSNG